MRSRLIVLLFFPAALMGGFTGSALVADECDTDLVYPPEAVVHGLRMEDYAARWWQWLVGVPIERNPMIDPTGKFCAVEQTGPVFFLTATFGGTNDRVTRIECKAPAGKEIFLPIIPYLAWAPGDCDPDRMEVCRGIIDGFVNNVNDLMFSIDIEGERQEEEIDCLDDHRHATATFDFTVPPENNILGLEEPFTRKGVADGFWLMLKPLPPGKHRIAFHATVDGFPTEFISYELTVQAECEDDRVHPPGSTVEGRTVADWSAAWWQWLAGIPLQNSPNLDLNGERCALGQSGPVFFLPGPPSGTTEPILRDRCVVPCNKPILFALVNVIAWAPGDCMPENMEECSVLAATIIDGVERLEATLDGVPIPCLEDHREVSPVFDFSLPPPPDENIFSLGPPFTRKGVSDGYWVLLKPLSPGEHTLVVEAELPGFELAKVTTVLTVAPCGAPTFRRGDADGDGILNLTDAVAVLERLFRGRAPLPCEDASDADDDGEVQITDAIYTLNHLFRGGPAPTAPGPDACGEDPTDDALACERGC